MPGYLNHNFNRNVNRNVNRNFNRYFSASATLRAAAVIVRSSTFTT